MKNNFTLRISITAACNLNCTYCNTKRVIDHKKIIKKSDLLGIIKAGYLAGVRKISWTGGEPTVRPDFLEIVKASKKIGIEKQRMTTNGILYYKMGKKLKDAGITKINFSLDTLNPKEYKDICGYAGFDCVIKSINEAIKLYKFVKINCVITKQNRHIIKEMVEHFDKHGNDKVVIRFLEIVPCGNLYEKDKNLFKKTFLPISEMIKELKKIGRLTKVPVEGDIPKSIYYKIAGKKGIYGVNPNPSVGYACDRGKCPKIRVSPNGFVSNCSIQLKYVRDFRNTTQREKNELMREIVEEKMNRNHKGFQHRQRYYDFWRFGMNPEFINKKFNEKNR